VARLSANKHKTEEEIALIAIDQIIRALNSMAESQKDLCNLAKEVLDELSKCKKEEKLEES
jgi:hypothetical protein